VARELGVRYVLEGSVRRSGQVLRISAQLVDAASANQIWAERYETKLKEAFAAQDAIAERVAGAIEPELLRTESLPAAARQSGNVTAWDLVRQGTWNFHHVGRDTHLRARELFRQACGLDPELAEAQSWLARVSAGLVAYRWSDDAARDIREGLDAAHRAIKLDEKNPYSHYALAICSAYANAPEQTILAAEKAIEISPSFALGHLVLGMGHLYRGGPGEAIPPLERGLTLNPYDPQNFVWHNLLALAYLFAGRADQALAAAVKGRKVRPAWRPVYVTLACCYAALGRLQEAGPSIDQLRHLEDPLGDALGPLRLRNPHWRDELANLLKKAGWQE
jgi:tetratricopeptide (TPR) repeat protein